MPHPSRIRRIAKWSGVVVCVVLVVAWIVSTRWFGAAYSTDALVKPRSVGVGVADGCVILGLLDGYAEGWEYTGPAMMSWPFIDSSRRNTILWLPLWIPFLTIALPTAYLFWRDRGHPRGHCQGCGYDLTGNVSGRCSECGKEIETETATLSSS